MKRENKLKVGVIGAGGRGCLSKAIPTNGLNAEIVALCDTNPDAFKQYEGCTSESVFTTSDHNALLARPDVEAVFVTVPDFLHEQYAIDALQAGKTVYLEKPMAITIEGCDRILKTAMECRQRLYLGHNMRHMFFVKKMKELADSGAIGEIKAAWCRHFISYGCDAYFKDWHADRRYSTGLLLQKAAHDIDVMHWICGGYTERVVGQGGLTLYDKITDRHSPDERGDASWHLENWPPLSQKQLNPVIDVEDVSHMLMRLDNGVLATYQQCHYTPDEGRNYTFIGTEGRIENYGEKVVLWNTRSYHKPEGDAQFTPDRESLDGGHGGADPKIVNEFIEFALHGGKTTTSPVAARNSVAAGYLATQSIRNDSMAYDIPKLDDAIIAYFEEQP